MQEKTSVATGEDDGSGTAMDEEERDRAKEQLDEIREAFTRNGQSYSVEHIVQFVREKLQSMPCLNQGYILDGFPDSLEDASTLFRST